MSLENGVKLGIRKTKIQEAVLGTLLATGTIAVALLAPNALSLIGRAIKARDIQTAKRASQRLVEKGFIEFKKDGSKVFAVLTEKGRQFLQTADVRNYKFKKPKKWDNKWRVVIFDIPETRKKIRDQIRFTLVRIGFIQLQKSVWVYPYDCEEFITLLKTDFMISRHMLYMIVDQIENDIHIKKHFGIKVG